MHPPFSRLCASSVKLFEQGWSRQIWKNAPFIFFKNMFWLDLMKKASCVFCFLLFMELCYLGECVGGYGHKILWCCTNYTQFSKIWVGMHHRRSNIFSIRFTKSLFTIASSY
jgi:hypothetical protein